MSHRWSLVWKMTWFDADQFLIFPKACKVFLKGSLRLYKCRKLEIGALIYHEGMDGRLPFSANGEQVSCSIETHSFVF